MPISWDLHDLIKIELNLEDRGIQLSKLYSSLCTAAPPLKKIGKEGRGGCTQASYTHVFSKLIREV